MIDPSNKDLVRLDGHTFNRETATLTCEHCRATETGVEQMQIISFAQAHRPCPHNATPDQQKAAQQRARHGYIIAACIQTGHAIAKSLHRMIRRAAKPARGKKEADGG